MLNTRVTVWTDIEGNLAYMNRLIDNSDVLELDKDGNLVWKADVLTDKCVHLVFAGDVGDSGVSDGKDPWTDRVITERLLKFNKAYPTRVHLILGHRDLNWVRFFQELDLPPYEETLDELQAWVNKKCTHTVKSILDNARWLSTAKRDDLVKLLFGFVKDDHGKFSTFKQGAAHFDHATSLLDANYRDGTGKNAALKHHPTRLVHLRAMLDGTMGRKGYFTAAKNDVVAKYKILKPEDAKLDAMTFVEIWGRVNPAGPVVASWGTVDNFEWRYLSAGKIITRVGLTLFVHGAITSQNVGWYPTGKFVPGTGENPSVKSAIPVITGGALEYVKIPTTTTTDMISVWEVSLNGWLQTSLALLSKKELSNEGYTCLVDYGINAEENAMHGGLSVMTASLASYADRQIDSYVAYTLLANSIRGVISGHRPSYDRPNLILSSDRAEDWASRVWMLTIDTSKSALMPGGPLDYTTPSHKVGGIEEWKASPRSDTEWMIAAVTGSDVTVSGHSDLLGPFRFSVISSQKPRDFNPVFSGRRLHLDPKTNTVCVDLVLQSGVKRWHHKISVDSVQNFGGPPFVILRNEVGDKKLTASRVDPSNPHLFQIVYPVGI